MCTARWENNSLVMMSYVVNGGYLVICLGVFTRHMGKNIDGFHGVHGTMLLVRGILTFKRMLLWLCPVKELCVPNKWFRRVE